MVKTFVDFVNSSKDSVSMFNALVSLAIKDGVVKRNEVPYIRFVYSDLDYDMKQRGISYAEFGDIVTNGNSRFQYDDMYYCLYYGKDEYGVFCPLFIRTFSDPQPVIEQASEILAKSSKVCSNT